MLSSPMAATMMSHCSACCRERRLNQRKPAGPFGHAIDRQAIVDIIYEGKSTITDYPCSHYLADFEPRFLNLHETYSVGYNPKRARAG